MPSPSPILSVMPAHADQQPRVGAATESFALADASALGPRLRGDDNMIKSLVPG